MLAFQFLDSLTDTCVYECHLHVQLPLRKQEPKCKERTIVNSMLLVSGLSANERYNFHFYNCKPQIFYGEMDVQTLPDRKPHLFVYIICIDFHFYSFII